MPFRPFSRETVYPMPPVLDDWVASDHPVRFVAAFVAALTDEEWTQMGIARTPSQRGATAYHPELLVCAWLAGFMLGIRSSRALEAACRDLVPLRWLTGNQQPDHNTLWRFYQAHRAGMRVLLRETVRLALAAGLLELAVVAVDGSKVSGSAARDRSYDAAGLLARLRAADGPERTNLTDPDAVLLSSRHGWLAGYNGQLAVTPVVADPSGLTGHCITAAEVTTDTHDHAQLLPLLAASRETAGQDADVALADGGYHSGATLAACREQGQVVVMPEGQRRPVAGAYHQQRFVYDAQQDGFTCPLGQTLTFAGEKTRRDRPTVRVYRASGATCRDCPAFGTCTSDARQGRSLEVSPWHADLTRHRVWMETEQASAWGRLRKTLPEPVFGIFKEQQGLRRFLLRGLANVTAEWGLLATAFNLRMLARYWRQGLLASALPG